MTTEIRCYACAAWFQKKDGACPKCKAPVRGVNLGLLSGRWSAALNASAADAVANT